MADKGKGKGKEDERPKANSNSKTQRVEFLQKIGFTPGEAEGFWKNGTPAEQQAVQGFIRQMLISSRGLGNSSASSMDTTLRGLTQQVDEMRKRGKFKDFAPNDMLNGITRLQPVEGGIDMAPATQRLREDLGMAPKEQKKSMAEEALAAKEAREAQKDPGNSLVLHSEANQNPRDHEPLPDQDPREHEPLPDFLRDDALGYDRPRGEKRPNEVWPQDLDPRRRKEQEMSEQELIPYPEGDDWEMDMNPDGPDWEMNMDPERPEENRLVPHDGRPGPQDMQVGPRRGDQEMVHYLPEADDEEEGWGHNMEEPEEDEEEEPLHVNRRLEPNDDPEMEPPGRDEDVPDAEQPLAPAGAEAEPPGLAGPQAGMVGGGPRQGDALEQQQQQPPTPAPPAQDAFAGAPPGGDQGQGSGGGGGGPVVINNEPAQGNPDITQALLDAYQEQVKKMEELRLQQDQELRKALEAEKARSLAQLETIAAGGSSGPSLSKDVLLGGLSAAHRYNQTEEGGPVGYMGYW